MLPPLPGLRGRKADTASALRPLATALKLGPAEGAAVRKAGRDAARGRKARSFSDVIAHFARDYPAHFEEFAQLSELFPPEARTATKPLIDDEVAKIDVARFS